MPFDLAVVDQQSIEGEFIDMLPDNKPLANPRSIGISVLAKLIFSSDHLSGMPWDDVGLKKYKHANEKRKVRRLPISSL